MARELSRRSLFAAAAGGAAALALPRSASAAPVLEPVSMAMHIHGPFSEGLASYEAHLHQARTHDVDVIWWTDHDFRVAAHDYRRQVRFDAAKEPENGLDWTWTKAIEGTLTAGTAEFVGTPHTPDQPGKALRLAATGGGPAGGTLWQVGTAWNYTAGGCIADTSLELDVLAERAGPNATLDLRIDLSYHPARGGFPAGLYVLRYRFGGVATPRYTADGLLGTVDLPSPTGSWVRHTLDLAGDVRALWPHLVADDNSLTALRLGVSAGAGASGAFVADRLVFTRTRRAGQAGEDLRTAVLARYSAEYPDVVHFRGYEASLVRHLNWYGGDQTLPAFASPPHRDNDPAKMQAMVDFLHQHGGIVSWNHPMDVEKKETLATLMLSRRYFGVDLVEIGRDPLADLLWAYDVAARNALFFTAIGSSDEHDGMDWLAAPERWITSVWSPSKTRADLIAALRKGAAWVTDPALYRGTVDLRIKGTTAMGSAIVTRNTTVTVECVAERLPSGSTLEIVTGRADMAGTAKLTPSTTIRKVAASSVSGGRYKTAVKPGAGVYVRTQVRTRDGALAAFSNPVWLLPKKPRHAIPVERQRTI